MDLTKVTPDELDDIEADVKAERVRRQGAALVEKQVGDVLAEARAGGVAPTPVPGAGWVQPSMAVEAYMKGDTVEHEGTVWVSTHDYNVHAPGVSGWREVPEDGSVPAWVQPSGQHDAYRIGDQVEFDGAVFESVIDWNAWSTAAYPAGWELVDSGDSDDDEPGDETPAWNPDSHNYTVGDQVTYRDDTYTVIQDHTSQGGWTPDSAASLYERKE